MAENFSFLEYVSRNKYSATHDLQAVKAVPFQGFLDRMLVLTQASVGSDRKKTVLKNRLNPWN